MNLTGAEVHQAKTPYLTATPSWEIGVQLKTKNNGAFILTQ
jgi:hypothetical protein